MKKTIEIPDGQVDKIKKEAIDYGSKSFKEYIESCFQLGRQLAIELSKKKKK